MVQQKPEDPKETEDWEKQKKAEEDRQVREEQKETEKWEAEKEQKRGDNS